MQIHNPYSAVIAVRWGELQRAYDELKALPREIATRYKLAEDICVYSQAIEFYVGDGEYETSELSQIATLCTDAAAMIESSIINDAAFEQLPIPQRARVRKYYEHTAARGKSLGSMANTPKPMFATAQ